MAHPQKEPLRPLTPMERRVLEQTVRSRSERVERVARARVLLAVAEGVSFTAAGRPAAVVLSSPLLGLWHQKKGK